MCIQDTWKGPKLQTVRVNMECIYMYISYLGHIYGKEIYSRHYSLTIRIQSMRKVWKQQMGNFRFTIMSLS